MDHVVVAIPGGVSNRPCRPSLGRLNVANLRKELDDLNFDGPPP